MCKDLEDLGALSDRIDGSRPLEFPTLRENIPARVSDRLLVPPNRLVQGLSLGGRLRGERRLLQRRGAPELRPRGRVGEEAGESLGICHPVARGARRAALASLLTSDIAGSREVHRGGRLREGGASGAVRQERGRCPADQRGGGGTVVSSVVVLSLMQQWGDFLLQTHCENTLWKRRINILWDV